MVAKVNDNRNVAYLNRNDHERNLNLNWFDNEWNENYRFAAVRKSIRWSTVYASRRASYQSRRLALTAPHTFLETALLPARRFSRKT